jgi:hypothetical protein
MSITDLVLIDKRYSSVLLYLLLHDLHLVLLDVFLHFVAALLGKALKVQPFSLLRAQLGSGLFDLHNELALPADVLDLRNALEMILMIQILDSVSGALDLLAQEFVDNFVLIELRLEGFEDLPFCLLDLGLKERVVGVFEHGD